MNSRGGNTDENITGLDLGQTRQDLVPFDGANNKASSVVVTLGVDAGHFGSFAANERTSRLQASINDALDHIPGLQDIQLPARKVVEEKQRIRSLSQHIVHIHGNEIDANRIMDPCALSNFELGADAVGSRDKNGIFETAGFQVKGPAETSNVGIRAHTPGRFDKRFDKVHQAVAGINVHSRRSIGKALLSGGVQSTLSNVLPELNSFKANTLDSFISLGNGFLDRRGNPGDSQDTAARSVQLAVLEVRAGVENNGCLKNDDG